jgi:methylated-DNA-protein-cysteine methyltransferase-like protein
MKNTFEVIYDAARRIPYGRVTTYGQLALLAGNPHWSRVVGYALNACPHGDVPCHRVVNRLGGLSAAFGPLGKESQRILLEMEGVTFLPGDRVDLACFMWYG